MGYIVSILFFFIGFLLHKIKRTWTSPDVFFCYEWAIISFLASLRLYGMFDVTTKAWAIIFVGTLSFVLCTNFKKNTIRNFSTDSDIAYKTEVLFQAPTFWIIALILYIYALISFRQSLKLLLSGVSLDQIRLASYGITEVEGYVRSTGFLNETFSSVREAFSIILTAAGIQSFIINPRENKKYFFTVLLLTIIKSFTTGGRFAIVYFTLELMTCYGIYKNAGIKYGFKLSVKAKKTVRTVMVASCALIMMLSILRGAEVVALTQKYYRYFCGNVVFLDKNIDKIDENGLWSTTFAGLYGVWNFIFPLLNKVGISYTSTYLSTIQTVMNTQDYQQIGTHMYTNAFITPYYHLYADFRWFGVIIGMAGFALLSRFIYDKAYKSLDTKYIVFFLIIIQMLFKTLQFYPLVSSDYVFTLIIMSMICKFQKAIRIDFRGCLNYDNKTSY